MTATYFYSFMVSFAAGVMLSSIFPFGFPFAILLFALGLVSYFLKGGAEERRIRLVVSLVFFGCAAGVLNVTFHNIQTEKTAHALDAVLGKMVSVEGIIVGEPDTRDGYTNVVLKARTLSQGQSFGRSQEMVRVLENTSRILVRVPEHPALLYGDEVALVGKIVAPKNFAPRDGERSFDYTAYLAKDDIFYQMYNPQVSLLARGQGNVVLEQLFAVKNMLVENIVRVIPEPEASLAVGVLLGAKATLGTELLQKFRDTGVAHIVVLSGYNIAIVASAIARVTAPLSFTVRLSVSALGVVLFAFMVSGGATVVRASLMALIAIFARATGREDDALRALTFTGVLMLVHNPRILFSDVSFQLSFVATLSLIVLVPILEKKFFVRSRAVRPKVLREIFLSTIATQIFVLPLLLYHMGSASLLGVITNLLILPAVPLVMLAAFLAGSFAWAPLLGAMLGYFSYAVLAYIIFVVELFSKIPYGSLRIETFSLTALIISYILLGLWVMKNFVRKVQKEKSLHKF